MSDTFSFTTEKDERTLEDFQRWDEDKQELWGALKKVFADLIHPDPRRSKSFRVDIGPERGGSMPAYWVLINILKNSFLDQGNMLAFDEYGVHYNVNDEKRLSEWVKVMAGHCDIIEHKGKKYAIGREIKYKSDCTWLDMKKLLDFLLRFGESEGIIGLVLKPKDEAKIKKGFGE